jgi:hypothetical protein
MKRFLIGILVFLLFFNDSNAININVTIAGTLNTLILDKNITNLTLTGSIDARDFLFLRDSLPKLSILDLSSVDIMEYTGTGGTSNNTSEAYTKNTIPTYAFCDPLTNTGKTTLTNITLPNNLSKIDKSAFWACTGIIGTLTIPSSVIEIGDEAFRYCSGLTGTLSIPPSVLSIGALAFDNATGFTSAFIPSTTISIGTYCFRDTPMSINIDNNNPFYSSDNGVLFDKNKTLIIHAPTNINGKYTIPSTVTIIGAAAFQNCTSLSEVVFPNNLVTIGDAAFLHCSAMNQQLIFPSTTLTIGANAFDECIQLTGPIKFPDNLITIGKSAFFGCKNFNGTLSFNDSLKVIGSNAFEGCLGLLGELKLPPKIKTIETATFKNCVSFTSLVLPSFVQTINSEAFNNCTSFNKIYNHSTIPAPIVSSVFKNLDKNNCTLFVPKSSKIAYASANVWKEFKHIIEGEDFWISTSDISVGKNPGDTANTSVLITSNTTWTVNSDVDWLSITPSTAINGDGTISVSTTQKNPYITTRTGTVTITAPGVPPQTIVVTQEAGDPTLEVSSLTSELAKEAGSKSNIAVTSNTTWTAVSDQAWLTVSPSTYSGSSILLFTSTQNNTLPTTRSANVTISAPGVAPKTIVVTQSDKITLIFSNDPTITTDKTYDKSSVANVTLGTVSGIDPLFPDVSVSIKAYFNDANAGKNKIIKVEYTLTGNDANKYLKPSDFFAFGNINPVTITVTAQVETKNYDTNSNSSKSPVISGTIIAPDSIKSNPSQFFIDKNANNLKILNASGLIIDDGNNGSNYNIKYVTAIGSIFPAPITVTALAEIKNYDGTTSSSITPLYNGILPPDIIGTKPTQAFYNKNCGTSKRIIASGIKVNDGNNGDNYIINYIENNLGTINQANVIVQAKNCMKIYDRKKVSDTVPEVKGLFAPDTISTYPTQAYDDWNVGNNKTISPSGLVIEDDNGGKNYIITYLPYNQGTIIPDTITVTASTDVKTYDRTKTSNASPIVSGLITPDTISVAPFQSFDDFNVGKIKNIIANGLVINDGNNGKNYSIIYKNNTGEIKPINITVTAVSDNKTYDGTTNSSKMPLILGTTLSPDTITSLPNQSFSNRNAQTNKTITPAGLLVNDGNNGANYSIQYIANNGGIISPKLITVTSQPDTKVYDGTDKSDISPLISGSIISPDTLDSIPIQYFDNRKVGINKTITSKGLKISDGNNGNNYQIIYIPNNQGIINKATVLLQLTVSTRADDKTYDGTNNVTIVDSKLNGVFPNDDVELDSIIGGFVQSTVGKNIPVNIRLTIKGNDILNYIITQPSGLVANIYPKELTVVNTLAIDKIYDASNTASITNATLNGVIGSDQVELTNTNSAVFSQKNVGNNIDIITNYLLSGKDTANYRLIQPSGIKANISPKPTQFNSTDLIVSKVYDGTSKTILNSIELIGIELSDYQNISALGNVNFDNANAGTNKMVSIQFQLSGIASSNYIAPVTYQNNVGKISPKQLHITKPNVDTIKMYDGTTSAHINTTGILNGIIPIDTSFVKLTANALYNSKDIEKNKWIVVSYSLTGNSKDNYLPPISDTIQNAKIMDQIRLNPLVKPEAGCEGSNINLNYKIISGECSEFKITFDSAALNQGMQHINYTTLPSSNDTSIISFQIPPKMGNGNYHAYLQLRNNLGIESPIYDFVYTINLTSDYIVSKYDDVVICDNSKFQFSKYQWYKNNLIIEGATEQFYYEPDGLVGTYSIQVETTSGQTLFCCPKYYNLPKKHKLSIQPNPVKSNSNLTLLLDGFSDFDLQDASLIIYSSIGSKLFERNQISEKNIIYITQATGIYFGRLTLKNGNKYTFEIIVTN